MGTFITTLSSNVSFFLPELLLENATSFVSFIINLLLFCSIIFDIIGIVVIAADEAPFHALASRKYFELNVL